MESEYFNLLMENDTYICCSLQRFGAIALKTKNLCEKFVLAQCSCIYLMTLSTLWSKFLGENRVSCEGRRGKPYFVYLSFRIHFHILAGPFFDQFWLYIKISNNYIQTDINKNGRAAFL